VSPAPAGPRRIVVTIDLDDDPLVEMLAVQALLRLVEWFHHEGTPPLRTALEIIHTELPTTP
jgi:hypothetical protein